MSLDLKKKDDESKRSVFDRLGPDTKSTSVNTSNSKISLKMPSVCPSYAKTGYCQLGSKCKYEHAKKEKGDTKSKTLKKASVEKINSYSKDLENKLKSTVVSKSSDDSDKRTKKITETSSKSSKQSDRSPSLGPKKKRTEEPDHIKQKDKKSKEEPRGDQKHYKTEEKSDKSSSKHKRLESSMTARNSSSSSKKTTESVLSPPSSKDGKSLEVERNQNKVTHPRLHPKSNADLKITTKPKSEPSRKELVEKREIPTKKECDLKDKKDDVVAATLAARSATSLKSEQKVSQSSNKTKNKSKSKMEVRTKRSQRSVTDSTSSSSSSGSSSSSSGSSSGSSSSYSSCERSSAGKKKRKIDDTKANKSSGKINSPNWSEKRAAKKPEEGSRQVNVKHSGEYSDNRLYDRVEEKMKRSKQKERDTPRGGKREYSGSISPRYVSPLARNREEPCYSGRAKAEEERYVRTKLSEPEYEHGRGSMDRAHENRSVKVDRFIEKGSPGVDVRRKESDYYRGEEYRYRRGDDDDYESLERRRSRERSMYDLPDKDEPVRRERLSRRGQWEKLETDGVARNKHKRHLSEESFSPARKKKRSTPRDDFRGDKIYESEGRKRDYERDDDSLLDDMRFKSRQRRSSHESWNQHSKERRTRRDKSDQERSRERGRDDYYTRSPPGSGDYSPRHRTEHGKRGGDYPGYDYDIERGRRSLSRSSIGSKPPGRSRFYEGKRSLGGNVASSHYPPPSYEFRDSYRASPETDIIEGSGRSFSGKAMYWDDYKRVDGPPAGSSSYRGLQPHARSSHTQSSSCGPPVDWDAGRVPSKQQSHDWDNRYERNSEEFLSRRDVLLPPPPRPRHENSEGPSPAPPSISNPSSSEATNVEVLKAMKFEMEGYEEITEEELDECLVEEDRDETGDKDGVQSTCEDEAEILPKKIPLVDMSDIEWETLVKADELRTMNVTACLEDQKFSDIIREIGVSRQFAGDELFQKINNILINESDDDAEEDDDDKRTSRKLSSDDRDNNIQRKTEENAANGLITEVKTEPKENGEETSHAQSSVVTQNCSEAKDGKNERPLIGSSVGKENHVIMENFDGHYVTKMSPLVSKMRKKRGPLLHDVANFHVTAFLKLRKQSSAMRDIGPYRKALCARRDLAIRRTLCRIEKDEIVMFPAQLADQELYKLSLQLFHQTNKAVQAVQHTLA